MDYPGKGMPLPPGVIALMVQHTFDPFRNQPGRHQLCQLPEEVQHGENLLYGSLAPRQKLYAIFRSNSIRLDFCNLARWMPHFQKFFAFALVP